MMDEISGKREKKQKRARKPFQGSVKLADVALRAGVSTATASRAINSPLLVSPDTRERVEMAVRDLNWIPHGAAKALASLRTRTIGAIVPTFGHQGIAGMVEALQGELARANYTLLLGWSRGDPDTALRQAFNMIERGVDALILMGEDQPAALMGVLEERDILHVIAYTSGKLGRSICIGFDNFAEMGKLTAHLLELGHTRFGVIARDFTHNDRIRQRVESINATLASEGIAVRPQHFIQVDHWLMGSGRKGMKLLLSRPPIPTAVICTNDYLAAGALIEAKSAGLSIPNDLSIVGFDDIELAAELDPPLTTLRVPAAEVGQEIAKYLLDRLERGSPSPPAPLSGELIIRSSTAPPRLDERPSGSNRGV